MERFSCGLPGKIRSDDELLVDRGRDGIVRDQIINLHLPSAMLGIRYIHNHSVLLSLLISASQKRAHAKGGIW